jgi:hypothetical protein
MDGITAWRKIGKYDPILEGRDSSPRKIDVFYD